MPTHNWFQTHEVGIDELVLKSPSSMDAKHKQTAGAVCYTRQLITLQAYLNTRTYTES